MSKKPEPIRYSGVQLWEALTMRNKGLSYARLGKLLGVPATEARRRVYAAIRCLGIRDVAKVLSNKVVNLPARYRGVTFKVTWPDGWLQAGPTVRR